MRGNHRSRAWNYVLRQYGAMLADQISKAILASEAGPGQQCTDPECPDFHRHEQARRDAATAVRVAKAVGEGRYPVSEPQPACPSVVAAEAVLAGGAR